jgi:hypothetical protein
VVDHQFIKQKQIWRSEGNETNCAREGIVLLKHLKNWKGEENVTDCVRENIGHLKQKHNCGDRGNVIDSERGSIGHLCQQKNWSSKGCGTCFVREGIVPLRDWRLRALCSAMDTYTKNNRKLTNSKKSPWVCIKPDVLTMIEHSIFFMVSQLH